MKKGDAPPCVTGIFDEKTKEPVEKFQIGTGVLPNPESLDEGNRVKILSGLAFGKCSQFEKGDDPRFKECIDTAKEKAGYGYVGSKTRAKLFEVLGGADTNPSTHRHTRVRFTARFTDQGPLSQWGREVCAGR